MIALFTTAAIDFQNLYGALESVVGTVWTAFVAVPSFIASIF